MSGTESSTRETPWPARHLDRYLAEAGGLPETAQMGRGMTLFLAAAQMKNLFPFASTFPNELAAAACMARAARQLEAATVLASFGFNAEVRYMLRGVYESAGLGRTLAKDTDEDRGLAARWLTEGTWWPDRVVRKWLEETRFVSTDQAEDYRNYYRESSAWAHPTRQSCMPLFAMGNDALELIREPEFDLEALRKTLVEITWTAVFACFAFRNAVADETLIPPAWRRELHELITELADEPLPHLERDWQVEQDRYDATTARLRSMDRLTEALNTDPRSATNLRRAADPERD